MDKIILFIVAIIPVIALMTYINSKDKNKEPMALLAKLFLGGIGSCFLVLFIGSIIRPIFPFMQLDLSKPNSFLDVFLYAFIGVALIEELCKFLMTYLIGYKHECFDEIYDIIVYSVFVALGFACFENILYVLGSGLQTGISRALLAVPGHACDGLFMGYYMCLAKIYQLKGNKSKETENIIKGIAMAVVLHGIYDFCCFAGGKYTTIIFFLFVIVMDIAAIKKINFMAKHNRNLFTKQKVNNNTEQEQQINTTDNNVQTSTIEKIQESEEKDKQPDSKNETNINKKNEHKNNDYFQFNKEKDGFTPKNSNTENFDFTDFVVPNIEAINSNNILNIEKSKTSEENNK